MRRHLIKRIFNERAIAGKALQQTRRVVISLDRDFVGGLQPRDRITGRAMNDAAEWIEAAAAID